MNISFKIFEYSSLESKLEHFAPPRQECEVLRWACLYVCLSVCLSAVCKTTCPNFVKFSVRVNHGRGSVLLWRQCNKLTLYISVLWMTSRLAISAIKWPDKGDANRAYTQNDSPGVRTVGEVWYLRLPCSRLSCSRRSRILGTALYY